MNHFPEAEIRLSARDDLFRRINFPNFQVLRRVTERYLPSYFLGGGFPGVKIGVVVKYFKINLTSGTEPGINGVQFFTGGLLPSLYEPLCTVSWAG